MSIRTAVAVALVVMTMPAAAQLKRISPPDEALDALVAKAIANAPEMTSAQASVEAARRRIVPAQTLADPFVSTTYQNDGRALSFGEAEGSFVGVMASQALPWPGKLRAAGEVAASEARELERSTDRTALTLEARVRNAWYDVQLARELDRIIEERRNTATQIEASVRERYAAGLSVQQDVLRAQVELARLDEQKAAQAATIAARTAELTRLTGVTEIAGGSLPELTAAPSIDELLDAARTRNPELAAAQLGIETSKARVALAKKNFLPDFTISGGSMYRGSFEMGPMWQAGVGVTIPLWIERRQQNQLAEAEALVRGRGADAETIARELDVRTRERAAQLEAALRIAQLYRDKVVPLDELSLESALASYQNGKLPFVSVLEAVNVLYSDRAAYATRVAESAKWRVAIDEAALAASAPMVSSQKAEGSGAAPSAMGSMR